MKWIETKIAIAGDKAALAVELIADLFHTLGNRGVVLDDPQLEPEQGWGDNAVAKPQIPAVTGYLPDDAQAGNRRRDLERRLSRIAAELDIACTITTATVDEEDWAESWKAFFWPENITPTIVVKPTWREYTPSKDQIIIDIDPGMAFGTGTHPTTALCVRLLQKYVKQNHSILDVGTGSGILLVAAAKLGATRLTGVDRDPVAVEVARKNLSLNRIDPRTYEVHCANLVDATATPHDIVVANILADVIIDLTAHVSPVLKPGGVFICSGIIEAHRGRVAEAIAAQGLDILDVEMEGDWVAFAARARE